MQSCSHFCLYYSDYWNKYALGRWPNCEITFSLFWRLGSEVRVWADLGSVETPHFLVYSCCLLFMPSLVEGWGTLLDLTWNMSHSGSSTSTSHYNPASYATTLKGWGGLEEHKHSVCVPTSGVWGGLMLRRCWKHLINEQMLWSFGWHLGIWLLFPVPLLAKSSISLKQHHSPMDSIIKIYS